MAVTMGSGISGGGKGDYLAGKLAASEAIDGIAVDSIHLCQVFCSVDYEYREMLSGVREVVGERAALIGCSTERSFTEDGVSDGVAVGVLAGDSVECFTGLGTGLRTNVSRSVREAVAEFPDRIDGYPYMAAINLHDGLCGVGEELALLTQQKLGPRVYVAGGSAADAHRLEATHVFHDDRVVEDAVVLALIAAEKRPVVSIAHGHEPLSEPVEVTRAEGSVVYEIDGKPAFEVWKDAVRETIYEEFDVDVDELEPTDLLLQRLTCEFEFGINQGDRYKMRWPWVEDDGTDALHFSVEVPEGTVFRVMHGSPDSQLESARETARQALREAGDDEIAGGFVYDCACRGIVLGDDFETAIEGLADELGAPLAGFETYGEVCSGPGQLSGFHNTTTVVLLFPA